MAPPIRKPQDGVNNPFILFVMYPNAYVIVLMCTEFLIFATKEDYDSAIGDIDPSTILFKYGGTDYIKTKSRLTTEAFKKSGRIFEKMLSNHRYGEYPFEGLTVDEVEYAAFIIKEANKYS